VVWCGVVWCRVYGIVCMARCCVGVVRWCDRVCGQIWRWVCLKLWGEDVGGYEEQLQRHMAVRPQLTDMLDCWQNMAARQFGLVLQTDVG